MHGDRGDIVIGWLTRVAVVLAVVSFLGFEAVSIGVARVRTGDLASSAAREGSEIWQRSRNVQTAYRAAYDVAEASGGTIAPEAFLADDNGTVTVTVCKEATSLFLHRFERTRAWLLTCETTTAKFVI